MVSEEAEIMGITSMTSRTGKAILCVQINVALRHAVAKHDPNAGRQDVLLLCDRTYSRITDHDEQKKEKRGESE